MTDLVSPYLSRPLRTEGQARADRLETTNAALLKALEALIKATKAALADGYSPESALYDAYAAIKRAREG